MPVDFPAPGPAILKPVVLSHAGGVRAGRASIANARGPGSFAPTRAQQRAVLKLQLLHEALLSYRPPARLGLLARLAGAGRAPVPRGLYLWGPVGRGKAMLMDLFFAAAPVANKRRVHFHAFMLEVHDRLEGERRAKTPEPVAKVAADLASGARLFSASAIRN